MRRMNRPLPRLRTADVLAAFDHSPGRVAAQLGITSQAVSQWGEFVPRGSAGELRLLRPDLFPIAGEGGGQGSEGVDGDDRGHAIKVSSLT